MYTTDAFSVPVVPEIVIGYVPWRARFDTWKRRVTEPPVTNVADVDSETPLGLPKADKLTVWPVPDETVEVSVEVIEPPRFVVPEVGDKLKA